MSVNPFYFWLAGLLVLATVLLAGMKLKGSIACSWWLVTMPLWAPLLVAMVVLVYALYCVSRDGWH